MNWIKRLLGIKPKNQCAIHDISNLFYCEVETDPRHGKCEEQCNHCKEEWNKIISN